MNALSCQRRHERGIDDALNAHLDLAAEVALDRGIQEPEREAGIAVAEVEAQRSAQRLMEPERKRGLLLRLAGAVARVRLA